MLVSYIGLGSMGGAMVSRLLDRGHEVHVFDLEDGLVDDMVGRGAIAAGDAAAAARAADVISVCVPAASHVEAVLDSMAGALGPRHTVLVHSTIGPDEARALAAKAAASEVSLHDAGIAGGATSAASGDVVLLVGGRDEMSEDAWRLCGDYANTVIDAGPIGAGSAFKLAMNVMTYAQFVATHVGHHVVAEAGGDPAALFRAWKAIGMFGSLAERFSVMCGMSAGDLESMQPFLKAQAENAAKDLRLAGRLPGVDDPSADVIGAISTAMTTVYRYTGELEERA